MITVVERAHDISGAGRLFDVHLGVGDAVIVHLLLQSLAVSAPGGAEHGDAARGWNVLTHRFTGAHLSSIAT